MHPLLYIPSEISDLKPLVRRAGGSQLVDELKSKAALGSSAASVVLAYLYLQGEIGGAVDYDRALSMLEKPLVRGDAFALYVRGWIYFLREKNSIKAVHCWKISSERGFLPAMIELGRFLWWDLPGKPPQPEAAIRRLKSAHRAGHKQAASLIAVLRIKGAHGPLSKAVHRIKWLVASARYMFWLWLDPCSEKVFSRRLI